MHHVDGISPTRRRQQDFSAAGISSTRRSVCMFCCWDFPRSEMATQTCPRAFLDCPTGVKILRCGIFPSRSAPLCCRDFPSQSACLMFCCWDSPLGTRTLAYGHPRLSLRADEYIHSSIFRSGIFPTRETTPMWDVPHTKDNSAVGLAFTLEVSDCYFG